MDADHMTGGMQGERSRYVLQETGGSFCQNCGQKVSLLAPRHPVPGFEPMFYICFLCNWVGEVGVGPVEVAGD